MGAVVGGSGRPIRALLVGPDARVRHALGGFLLAAGRAEIVDEAATPADAVAAIGRQCPAIVVIDLGSSSVAAGFEVIAAVRSTASATAIVAVGDGAGLATGALAAGADAFLSTLDSPRTLCDLVDAAARRRIGLGSRDRLPLET